MKSICFTLLLALLCGVCASTAEATELRLTPSSLSPTEGDAFSLEIRADIDVADEILGFGFDLFVNGAQLVNQGNGNGILRYNNFTPNPIFFAFDSNLSTDPDGISAFLHDLFFDPPVSGANVLLGSLNFTAIGAGSSQVTLGADDLGPTGLEGLVPAAIGASSFMPPVNTASVSVQPRPSTAIPEPTTLILLRGRLYGATAGTTALRSVGRSAMEEVAASGNCRRC